MTNPNTTIVLTADDQTAQALQAFVANMKAAQAQANSLGQGLGQATAPMQQLGASAAQTAAAMRMVPAQVTDIVVSLQAGQKPLTVLMQQGGQLKDMFGGVGNATKALGTYIGGLLTPTNLAIAAVAGLGLAYYQGSQEASAFQKAITLSGNAAGVTAGQMQDMARGLAVMQGTQSAASAALIEMASTGRVAGESLQTYTRSALDMERAVGTSVAETAKAFAQLGEAPLQASLKLNESTNYLTVALYKQIKALEDQGRATDAAKVAQDAYASMTEQRAQSILQNLGYVERAWLGIKDAAKMAGDVIMDLGRSATPTDQLAAINAQINEVMRGNGLKNASLSQAIRGMFDDTVVSKEILPALQAQAAAVAATTYAQEQNSKALAEGNERLKARAAFDTEQAKFLSNELKMRQEIAKVRAQYQAADGEISAKERDALIQNIRDKYKEKSPSTAAGAGENEVARIRALIKEEETLTARIKERGIEGAKLSDSEKLVARIQEDLKTSISGVARANKEAALVEAQRYVQVQASRTEQEKQAQAVADSQKAYDALVADTRKAAAAIGQQASELEAANAVWGKGKTAIEEFRLEQMKLKLQEADSSDSFRPDYVAELRAQVAEQERLLTASRVKDYKTLAQAQEEYTRKVEEEALLYTDEVGLLGQTTREREKIVAVRKVELELAKQLAAIDRSGASAEDKARLVDQAQAAAAIARSTALAKSELNTLTDIINSVDHTAQSVWTNVFQGGQSAFEKVGATIKASVLDMLYQLTIRRWVVSITANVLGGLGGGLGGGSSGLLNLAGGASNLYGGASLIGSGVGALFGTTAGNAAMGVSMGLGAGSSSAAAVAAAQAGGMGAGAAGAAGLGTSIGSAIPYVGAALAAYSLLSSLNGGETRSGGQYGVAYDGQVKNNRRDEVYTYEGQQYNRDNSLRPDGTRKSVTNGQAYLLEADGMGDREDATRKAVSSTAESINAMLKSLGSKAFLTDYHAGLETSGNGRGGVFAGGTLSNGFKFGESGQGSNYSGTLYETSSTRSPDMATAVANFTLDLKQSTIQALQAAQDIPQSVAAKLKDIDAEKLSDDEATKLITEINSQIASVEALRTLAGALPLKSLKDLSFDAADGLITLAGGIEALNQKISSYYENFYTQDERNAQTLGNVSAALKSVGLATPKTREAFRALVEAQDLSTESGRKAYATLMNVADAFASVTPSAEEAAKATQAKADADKAQAEAAADAKKKALQAATDAAYASLERAVAAEKSRLQAAKQVAQESVNTLGSLLNTLKGHVTELYNAVEATQAQSARAGLQFIDQALGTARSTVYLPDATSLSDAITAARSGLDSSQFGSAFEQQRAQLTLAGKLAELKDLTGVQKSVAEQQLATAEDQLASLDKILSNAKDQVDALRGIDTSVLSVGLALEKLAGALLGEQDGSASATKPGVQVTDPGSQFTVGGGGSGTGPATGGSSGGFTVGGGGGGTSSPSTKYSREVNLGAGTFTVGVTDPAEISRLDSLATLAQQFTGTGNVKGLLEATQASGATLSDLATVAGFRYEDLLKAAESVGVPRFAVGTNYVPQDMLALIHEGEAIVPKAYNPAYNPAAHALPQASSASSELLMRLIAEVQALRAQTAQLEAQARRTADATNGNPEGGAVPMALVEDHTQ
ncbi:MAG: phage tail length tape measure family protein [Curvibacter lanceolatus]|uniref:phage tail length tape measure family protein n=1 Tax=Curvibacter lanceolatus TaxID=86182 RepID=UPI002357BFCA|nr:phage tail length tape measure family protein [Curvibacter lanceolatus]MBV5295519.1 phage tail length tape measure family protein [Curvibacter lanceolatus]